MLAVVLSLGSTEELPVFELTAQSSANPPNVLGLLSGAVFPSGMFQLSVNPPNVLGLLSGAVFPSGMFQLSVNPSNVLGLLSGAVFPSGMFQLSVNPSNVLGLLSGAVFPSGMFQLTVPEKSSELVNVAGLLDGVTLFHSVSKVLASLEVSSP